MDLIEHIGTFPIIKNIFINENTRFTHLYIPHLFDYQIHGLISEAKNCFSELEFLSCNTSIDDNVLIGLIEICKSIKELKLIIGNYNNNYGINKILSSLINLKVLELNSDVYNAGDWNYLRF